MPLVSGRAALAAHGRRLVAVGDSEVACGPVRDMIHALKGIGCARQDTAPQAMLTAASAACGDAG